MGIIKELEFTGTIKDKFPLFTAIKKNRNEK